MYDLLIKISSGTDLMHGSLMQPEFEVDQFEKDGTPKRPISGCS